METNKIIEALNDADTAFCVLNIGQDHGITPQAAKACREAWAKINAALYAAKGRPDDAYPDGILKNAFRDCHCS